MQANTTTSTKQPANLIRLNSVLNKTGLSRSTIYRLMSKGNFPKQVKLSERAMAWSSEAIDAWIDEKLGGKAA